LSCATDHSSSPFDQGIEHNRSAGSPGDNSNDKFYAAISPDAVPWQAAKQKSQHLQGGGSRVRYQS
jgi:hypothetical protein